MLGIISSFVVFGLKFFNRFLFFQRKVPGAGPMASFSVREECCKEGQAGALGSVFLTVQPGL